MRRLNYAHLNRLLLRAEEVANEPGMNPVVKSIYDHTLKPKAEPYRAAFNAIAAAQSKSKKEGNEAETAVKALEPHYKTARSAVLAIEPSTVLPKTLSAQTTDTDTLYAIEQLIDAVDDYVGQTWADKLLSGDFGTASKKAVSELVESIAANKDLSTAINDRAKAFGPAYEAFIPFKRVVRDACGPSSKQYRRLHMRAAKKGEGESGGEGGGEGEEVVDENEQEEQPKATTEPAKGSAPEAGEAEGGAPEAGAPEAGTPGEPEKKPA